MAEEQQGFPTNTMDQDLYQQIAARDRVVQEKKPKRSIVMLIMIDFMRLTLRLDEIRRKNQALFRVLGGVWAFVLSLLYTAGLVMMCILVYNYLQFPNMVRRYFEDSGIVFAKMDIPGYIVSRVELKDLRDKNDSYRIKKLSVHSNFGDFLRKHVKSITLEGVEVNLDKTNEKEAPNNLLAVLMRLNDPKKSHLNVRVDSLEIRNAVLVVKNENINLPVNFSLTGVYGQETNMSATVNVNRPNLTVSGLLLIKGKGQNINFDLELHPGQVVMPGRPPETISGKITLETNNANVKSFTSRLSLISNRFEKIIKFDVSKGRAKTYSGIFDLSVMETRDNGSRYEAVNTIVNMPSVEFSKEGWMQTKEKISLSIRSNLPRLEIGHTNMELKGDLKCVATEYCSFGLLEASKITAGQVGFPFQNDTLKSTRDFSASLSKSPKAFYFPFKEGKMTFDVNWSQTSLTARRESDNGMVSLASGDGSVQGEWDILTGRLLTNLSVKKVEYQTPNYELSNAALEVTDMFGPSARVALATPRMALKQNDLLKKPFDLDYVSQNGKSRVLLSFKPEQTSILLNGILNPVTGYIDAQIVVPPFNLKNLGASPFEFSSLFPKKIQKAEGEMAVFGRISGRPVTGLSGPLSVAVSDVGLTTEQLRVEGMTTLLNIQTVKPFVTAAQQPIFMQHLETVVPFDNVRAVFKIDNQFMRLDRLNAQLAGVPMQGDMAIIPYQNVSTLLYLRSQSSDMASVANYLKIPNWQLKAPIKGDILLPIEIKDNQLTITRADVRLNQGTAVYTGNAEDKPKAMNGGDSLDIRFGGIAAEQTDNKLKMNVDLNTRVMPGKKLWNIRKITDAPVLSWFGRPIETMPAPTDISTAVRRIFQQSKSVMMQEVRGKK